MNSLVLATGDIQAYGAIIDGEVAIPTENGHTDFGALESELKKSGSAQIAFFAFDLLYLDSLDLRRVPLIDRKEILRLLLARVNHPIAYSDHLEGDGAAVVKQACRMGLEGIVSKRADASYVSGRVTNWIKTVCRMRDTFLVAGWAQEGKKFDGLYLAKKSGRVFSYAGKLERRISDAEAHALLARVRPLATPKKPMTASRLRFPKANWVRPVLKVEAEFRGKTAEGLLRHPSFKGLREDLG